jgi:low affinity Fe/Cu permease
MTLLIQRSWHRDTQAIHAKLDELLRATEAARNELAKIDQEQPETIELARAADHKSIA